MTSKLPIRWRLTLWYASFLGAALILFGVAIYFAVRHEVFDSFKEDLNNRTAAAESAIDSDSPDLTLDSIAIANLSDEEHFVRILTSEGRVVVDTSQELGVPPPNPDVIAGSLSGDERISKVEGTEGRVWVTTTPIDRGGSFAGVLQVGSSSEDEDDLVNILLISLFVAAPIVLILASFGGYVLAGRVLRPITEITNLAQGISADQLGARINLDLPDDEIGRLARTFDAMLARIEDAFERQRRFTGDAAHELRTPLTLVRSQLDIALARSRSADEYREALVAIDNDVDRLTSLVTTLLTLARSDTGTLVVERVPFRIDETIRSILSQYSPQAESARVALIDESTAATVEGDEDLLLQVLINLLDNAIAHTPENGQIAVGNRIQDDNVRIWVEDNGVGIAEAHISNVFDRFYRVDLGRTRGEGGIGLGLAISQAIVEAHEGTITLTSSLGEGTRVEIILPTAS